MAYFHRKVFYFLVRWETTIILLIHHCLAFLVSSYEIRLQGVLGLLVLWLLLEFQARVAAKTCFSSCFHVGWQLLRYKDCMSTSLAIRLVESLHWGYSSRKIPSFNLISCRNCGFPQNFHTRKLGGIMVFYPVSTLI